MYSSPTACYFKEINEVAILSRGEEVALAARVIQGDPRSRERMIRANLRLVVHIAKGYLDRGLALEDLIAEGNLGLMRAVETFDHETGVRFSTYASFWIKQSIRGTVFKQGKAVRLPMHMVTLLSKWRRTAAALGERLGRMPRPEEVAEVLNLPKKKQALVTQALEVNRLLARLDDFDGDNGDDAAMATLVDRRTIAGVDLLIEADELEGIFGALNRIDEREAKVLRMRFGLVPYLPMTLKEIGKVLGLTRERVRQIEEGVLRRLHAELGDPTPEESVAFDNS